MSRKMLMTDPFANTLGNRDLVTGNDPVRFRKGRKSPLVLDAERRSRLAEGDDEEEEEEIEEDDDEDTLDKDAEKKKKEYAKQSKKWKS